ncbi:bi-domain-containing oxidoreductase [Dyadobacter arcticus]|uniref:Dehydrogenase/threonine dehydrogenase-like Zn-dependent dehydrogenase n=1 Tax=Dyadobacter arcticus TaxID=1078754 RepID=A0ABX0URT3_9BACT|nr:bi-domain-containing oxidoreductase [Dyadobacter arcticus]NIJ55657.1 putative dehydrogenase/threonine dehydrogenase-like Zn-dependent dehydrogenase [Dyadobacter arcticus]
MKQLAQNLRTGQTILAEVPAPIVKKGYVLIQSRKSLISAGTERMLVEFSKANLFEKARQQPEKLILVLDKIRSDGFLNTFKAVSGRLNQLMPLGYCNVGEVIQVGDGVSGFMNGDRVVSNGPHAEIVCVPANLVTKIPSNVPDEEAVFTVLAAIGLQGIRLLKPALGESVVVIGLGLIGLLAATLLRANGCRVIGIEPDLKRLELAVKMGILSINPNDCDVAKRVADLTGGVGADGVLIAASSKSGAIISQAASIARKRGKIVLIGNIGLNLNRAVFYQKELTFQVSCSYGPGRYDPNYEQGGVDYPLPFVRWTENRNFQAILDMLSMGLLNVKPLISNIIPLQDFGHFYSNKSNAPATIINYQQPNLTPALKEFKTSFFPPTDLVCGIIGAGNFTRMTLLPNLKGKSLKYLASLSGFTAAELAKKYKIPFATADYQVILADSEVDLVFITTRHDQHARMVIDAMQAKKHIFVEKPLAILPADLEEIIHVYQQSEASLTVGFNRRFSPYALKMKKLLVDAPMNVVVTVNAGYLPMDAWLNDLSIGGGRIVGEACHFIDFITFLTGSLISEVCTNALSDHSSFCQNGNILLRYANGSTGVVNYFSNGHSTYPKERVEVYFTGRTLILDDFRNLTGYGFKGFSGLKIRKEKGHKAQFEKLLESVKSGGPAIIAFEEIINTTRATFAAVESLRKGTWIRVP